MHVAANATVVVDAGPRIDNAVLADRTTGLDDDASHHLDAVAQNDAGAIQADGWTSAGKSYPRARQMA
mgnify:CR=1 FL=1